MRHRAGPASRRCGSRTARTWVAFGAYDKAVHFLDGDDRRATSSRRSRPATSSRARSPSTPTGSRCSTPARRDNSYHVLAARPRRGARGAVDAVGRRGVSPTKWNNDWDGSALVIDDYLFEGGENSQFHIVKLNRVDGADGKVTVAPELVFNTPGWDDELLAGDRRPGRVDRELGRHLRQHRLLRQLRRPRAGLGHHRAGRGRRRPTADVPLLDRRRHRRLDRRRRRGDALRRRRSTSGAPSRPARGRPAHEARPVASPTTRSCGRSTTTSCQPGGIWATPALARRHGLRRRPTAAGSSASTRRPARSAGRSSCPGPTWQSPVVVDDVLIQGDCNGVLHAYDVSDPGVDPPELWTVELGGCIESTPAVWNGRIYVGTRAGRFYAIGDR